MAHLPVIENVYRVAVEHRRTDSLPDHAVNVLHVEALSDNTPSGIFDILDSTITGSEPWAPLSSALNEHGVTVTITPLDGVTPGEPFTTTNAAWSGLSSGDQIPEAALGITLKTARRGKSYRGRLFIGPVCEPSINNGVINSTGVGDCVAAWTGWSNRLIAHSPSLAFVVASYRHATAEQVTSFAGHTQARTQRQRLTRLR